MEPLNKLVRKIDSFDITGQSPASVKSENSDALPKAYDQTTSQQQQHQHQHQQQPPAASASNHKRTNSFSRKVRPLSQQQQLKHALKVNAAHVITQDYLTLKQPLSQGLLLMDRTDRKLKMIHSLGELQPLHSYTTEYGNSLTRPTMHKALLAGSIEVEVHHDEVDFDRQLEALALKSEPGSKPLQVEQRQAAYRAFVASESGDSVPPDVGEAASVKSVQSDHTPPLLAGERLEETHALERLERLTERLSEMESWFESVQAESTSERQIREQATARLNLVQERLERLQEQLSAQTAENKLLRARLHELKQADPDQYGRFRA